MTKRSPFPDPEETKECYDNLRDSSRDNLIEIIQTLDPWVPSHIAAKQILGKRDQEESDRKHKEGLKVQRAAIVLSVVAIVVSVISLLLSILK